jgi:hypothetical protein
MSRVDDANVYGPRRVIDWESLPGQILQAMIPHLPAEPIDRTCVEVEQRVTVDGVMFRCIADVLHGGVWDHKTSKDIRAYALMSHDVAIALGVPERSLRDDLQACINALAYADTILADRESDERITCNWTCAETTPSGKTRRVLPVRQEIPIEHALGVVRKAAELAKTLTYETSADAPADTLRCDDYGGCWYRRAGHCTKPRRWGGVFRQLELKLERTSSKAERSERYARASQGGSGSAQGGGAKARQGGGAKARQGGSQATRPARGRGVGRG